MDAMNDQRAEALRLAKEAGLHEIFDMRQREYGSQNAAIYFLASVERLIALARASAAPQEPVVKEWRDLGKEHFDKLRREANYAAQCHDAAMKLFTEASAIHGDDLADPRTVENLRDVLAAAPQPQAAPQEPVAFEDFWPDFADSMGYQYGSDALSLVKQGWEWHQKYAAPQPQAPSSDDVRDSLDGQELRRAVAQIGVVGQIDGHDVVRRLSVLDIIDRRVK
jgi:hypothetical protein